MLLFHKPAPSTNTTYVVSNQFAYVNRQIYHNSLHIPVTFHTCLESHINSRKYHQPLVFLPLRDVSKVLHEKNDVSGYRLCTLKPRKEEDEVSGSLLFYTINCWIETVKGILHQASWPIRFGCARGLLNRPHSITLADLTDRSLCKTVNLLTCADTTSLIWTMGTESDSDLITASACSIIMMAAMIRQYRDRRQHDARTHRSFILSRPTSLFPPVNIPLKKSSIGPQFAELLGLLHY